jgi:hypothetical protein
MKRWHKISHKCPEISHICPNNLCYDGIVGNRETESITSSGFFMPSRLVDVCGVWDSGEYRASIGISICCG